jgi:hypothetical protein
MFSDAFLGTHRWHSIVKAMATTLNPDGGDHAIEQAKLILCDHGVWPISIAADVEASGETGTNNLSG